LEERNHRRAGVYRSVRDAVQGVIRKVALVDQLCWPQGDQLEIHENSHEHSEELFTNLQK
jgi:hypothetical protein